MDHLDCQHIVVKNTDRRSYKNTYVLPVNVQFYTVNATNNEFLPNVTVNIAVIHRESINAVNIDMGNPAEVYFTVNCTPNK